MACGRRFRILNILDDVTKECLAAIADTSISGKRVARELTDLIAWRGKPELMVSDNGTEFTSNAMLRELPGTPAGRTLERDPVLRARRRPLRARALGRRLQCVPATLSARL